MSAASDHKDLYAQIPTFQCIEGCTDCCGPVPFDKFEWGQVKVKKKAKDLNCPYSSAGYCSIYDHRPFICRLFGTAPEEPHLRCPHGKQPIVPLPPSQARALTDQYTTLMDDTHHGPHRETVTNILKR